MRAFSFAIPALMDGMIALVQVALPLLAMQFGASAWFLGLLGWTAPGLRLPVCFGAGMLSEKVRRTRVIIPAAVVAALACIGLARAGNNSHVLVMYILFMVAIGAFYPALQAFIGDRSPKGELRKNLSAFNAGWTIGGSVCGLAAGYIFAVRRGLPFEVGAFLAVAVILLVYAWSASSDRISRAGLYANSIPSGPGPGPLLAIARMGHFLGFFAYAAARQLFPKLAVDLGMRPGEIGLLVGTLLVGQALGIAVAGAGPWWRGKLWPQMLAQAMVLVSGLIVFAVSTRALFAAAFLIQGVGLGIAYTGALYYGLQARTNMGRNTGVHESLVAGGNIAGSLVGGATAEFISLRTPYMATAVLAGLLMLASLAYWRGSEPSLRSTASTSG